VWMLSISFSNLSGELSSMSRQNDEMHAPEDFFSHQALELTFRLLRNNNPGLADALKRTLDNVQWVPYEVLGPAHTGEMHYNAHILELLNVHTIGRIVSALTHIGEQALKKRDMPQEHLNLLRNVIDDWVMLTEWILQHDHHGKRIYH
jgi:hypothetical protein